MVPRVQVLLFATAREAVGRAELARAVPASGASLTEFLAELTAEYPPLARIVRASRIVRNGTYLAGREGRVHPGDEIAIHPPYSGG